MRRLAAIMFTDIVGYSALSHKNESLALELLDEHRAILRPSFERHDGKEIETAGDSFFVEFNSAVEAANCAIEIQTLLHERNKDQPADRQINLRIGVHIGDVVHMQNHVHGDGVNIAARVQPLARPGEICVSEDVARQINNKIRYPLAKVGRRKLKNIDTPVDIYSIRLPWTKVNTGIKSKIPRYRKVALYTLFLSIVAFVLYYGFADRPHKLPPDQLRFRVAVLPLVNISANQEDEYFADGMTEELISSLSKISGLRVIARSSVMKYKNMSKDIQEIGRELMVGSVLEGSVRKVDQKARITVQLINVSTQEPIWSMDYDRELKDIFSIQSEIARRVADELKVLLASSEKKELEKTVTGDMEAFQEYLIGKYFLNMKTSDGIRMAIHHLERAVNYDEEFALAYASLAYSYTLLGVAGFGGTPEEMADKKAKEAIMKALEIDNNLAEAHAALAYIRFRVDWDWKGADEEFQRAIALKPGYSTAHEWYGFYLMLMDRAKDALRELKSAQELDPLSLSVNTGLGRQYTFQNEFVKAHAQFKKVLDIDPDYGEGYFAMGMNFYKMKDYKKAEEVLIKAVDLSGRRPVVVAFLAVVFAQQNKLAEANNLLNELEQPPLTNDKLYAIGTIKLGLGQEEKTVEILEKLYEDHYGLLIFLNSERGLYEGGMFHKKENIARLENILKKMGFEDVR
ncbi:MAG TPA: adenylate/guanylate cyclase domain-containing protein [Cyclobacteriaceae bacterium]|nr:adenylate/guanylate cyclase domain-containing protein [Cyclobacteriaceae bacterium]